MLVIRPSVFNRYILAFDKCGLVQAPMKCGHGLPGVTGRFALEESNDRHFRLLRARRERPSGRAAEQRDELAAAAHSINSSARASSVGGKVRPSALAVLRLITSSYLVGACTGRSAGFSPLRMRST